MEILNDPVLLSRLQFALTAMFHILWPVLTIGLSLFLFVLEVLWLKTDDDVYYHHARFWSKLFVLNFAMGVVTGLPLEFEFGTNWAPFSRLSGDFFGNILGFEGAMAFMLEAGFIGVMMLGWKRVSKGAHLFATGMVALGASMSAFWIMVANSWMQTPTGGHIEAGHFVIDNYLQAIFNPIAFVSVAHMWLACLETSLFVIAGISAWLILRGPASPFFLRSFKLAVVAAVVVAPLQIGFGDVSGSSVFRHQPAKGAAIEGHWSTNRQGEGADWALLAWPNADMQANDWSLNLPNGLSLLATHSLHGTVRGLKEFAREDQPPALPLLFYSFRVMVLIGFWFLILTLWTLWRWYRGRLVTNRVRENYWLLRAWALSLPLGYLAVESGWLVREVGRQPWAIYGLLRTSEAASALPAESIAMTLFVYTGIYGTLLTVFLVFARRILLSSPGFEGTPVAVSNVA
jgi:cytochrome bd ubiquinol oxidase subunit I